MDITADGHKRYRTLQLIDFTADGHKRYKTSQHMDITADGHIRYRTLQHMDFNANGRDRYRSSQPMDFPPMNLTATEHHSTWILPPVSGQMPEWTPSRKAQIQRTPSRMDTIPNELFIVTEVLHICMFGKNFLQRRF